MTQSNKKMSVTQLTFLTAMNMMGSGIILLPTKLAQIGTISIISWVITALGSASLAYAFAKCSHYSKFLGLGGYAENAFGKSGNFLSNYTYCGGLVVANVAVAVTCIGYAGQLLGIKFEPSVVCMLAIAVLWFCTMANFFGASITGRISEFAVWFVVIPVFGLSFIGWFWFDPQLYISAWNPHDTPFFTAINSSIAMTLWSFLGLESACANSAAVENPEKNVPKAVLTATLVVAVIYITSTNVVAGIIPNAELANSNAPYGLVYAHIFGPWAGKVAMGMLVISCMSCTLGWQFTISKVFQLAAVQGFFPQLFAKTNRFGAPIFGMVTIAMMQTCLCFLTVNPTLFKQFNVLVDLAVVLNIMPYLLAMSALPVILKKAHVPAQQSRIYVSFAMIAVAYTFFAFFSAGLTEMFYGALLTFFGWVLWGIIAVKFVNLNESSADNPMVFKPQQVTRRSAAD